MAGGTFAGGWWAAARFQSPAQRAAGAVAPSPGALVVGVSRSTLAQVVTAQADVVAASVTTIAVPMAASGLSVVTASPSVTGTQVSAGAVLAEVSGRPLFAVPGSFPFYRELTEGDEGPDVRQLQQALGAAGIRPTVQADGVFGTRTAAAVLALYRRSGYSTSLVTSPVVAPAEPPVSTSADEVSAVGTASTSTQTVVSVPAGDFLVVPALPALLQSAPGVGATITADSSMTFWNGDLVASSSVPPGTAATVPAEAPVRLSATDGQAVDAVVSAATPSADGTEVLLSYRASSPLPASWAGTTVLATITIQAVDGVHLVVPSRAVADSGSGDSVLVERDQRWEQVRVTVLGTLSGSSAIEPVDDGALVEGDRVKVG